MTTTPPRQMQQQQQQQQQQQMPLPALEFAMDILHRAAVLGEPGALSFLHRTSSIYLLDASDPSTAPKTYGCWNFIHQAMNELERYEASMMMRARAATAAAAAAAANNTNGGTGNDLLLLLFTTDVTLPLVQLLATMSQRVAQRSPSTDRALVATCIHNASQSLYHGSQRQQQQQQQQHEAQLQQQALIQANHDLREIVMGRIAAMVFDPSYHSPQQYQQHHQQQQQIYESAFANPMAMESFCAVLSANAVSSGPHAMNHFVTEWIVPSVQTLPPFAVVCVTLHVAQQAMRTPYAPAGSRDMLRRLVPSIMAQVLGPILAEAILERDTSTAAVTTTTTSSSSSSSSSLSLHTRNNRIAAMAIRALECWCQVTDVSLAQVKAICTEVQELCGIATTILSQECQDVLCFQPIFVFVKATIETLGDSINKSDSITQVRPSVIKLLIAGSCGRLNRASLDDVAVLLHAQLSSFREYSEARKNHYCLIAP